MKNFEKFFIFDNLYWNCGFILYLYFCRSTAWTTSCYSARFYFYRQSARRTALPGRWWQTVQVAIYDIGSCTEHQMHVGWNNIFWYCNLRVIFKCSFCLLQRSIKMFHFRLTWKLGSVQPTLAIRRRLVVTAQPAMKQLWYSSGNIMYQYTRSRKTISGAPPLPIIFHQAIRWRQVSF